MIPFPVGDLQLRRQNGIRIQLAALFLLNHLLRSVMPSPSQAPEQEAYTNALEIEEYMSSEGQLVCGVCQYLQFTGIGAARYLL